jgi:predicted nicotinamide N-methyase
MELGAGLGLPSLLCCGLASRVVSCDLNPQAVAKLRELYTARGLGATATAHQLSWTEAGALAELAAAERVEVLLLADVVYPMKETASLLAALARLRERLPGLTTLLSITKRDTAHADQFLAELSALCPDEGPAAMVGAEVEKGTDPLYGPCRVFVYSLPPSNRQVC